MPNRADDIRRRHEERKKQRPSSNFSSRRPAVFQDADSREKGQSTNRNALHEGSSREGHPLVRKEGVIFRVMLAAVLFLVVGVMFKNQSPAFDQARTFVKNTFQHEFQFAMVSDWYQNKFGEPLALLPQSKGNEMKVDQPQGPNYAMPVNGTVTENFRDTGQKGILLETGSKTAAVKAVKQGIVTYVGPKDGLGKTVVIQLNDGGEAWYGKLAKVDVKLYDFVKRGEKLGTVTASKDGKSGTFFFAMKKDNAFINPLEVIHFNE